MPYITEDGARKVHYKSLKNYLLTVPLMALTVIPRLFALGLFFASCRGPIAIGILTAIGVVYAITFWAVRWTKLKNMNKDAHTHFLLLSFLTAVFGPCLVMNPEMNLFMFCSTISAIGHSLLLVTLYSILRISPDLLNRPNIPNFIEVYVPEYQTYCLYLLPALLASIFFSWILQAYANEENRQLVGLRLHCGPLSCEKHEQFHWACRKKYSKIIKIHLQSGNEKILNAMDHDLSLIHI